MRKASGPANDCVVRWSEGVAERRLAKSRPDQVGWAPEGARDSHVLSVQSCVDSSDRIYRCGRGQPRASAVDPAAR